MIDLINSLKNNKSIKVGSQIGRVSSEPYNADNKNA
jgi:hypothetical protein